MVAEFTVVTDTSFQIPVAPALTVTLFFFIGIHGILSTHTINNLPVKVRIVDRKTGTIHLRLIERSISLYMADYSSHIRIIRIIGSLDVDRQTFGNEIQLLL